MKLICKKVGPTKDRFKLTLGKEYESIEHYINRYDDTIIQSYRVINDEGLKCLYDQTMFYSLEEIRDMKLKKLGI
jgi:hypothetical protein